MTMRAIINLIESADRSQTDAVTMYHITDNPSFALDPNHEPKDNTISIHDRSGNKGVYLTRDVEPWVNGKGYIRPFVAEIAVDPQVLEQNHLGRWQGEVFVAAEDFDHLRVKRVVPLDVIARETYGSHGWIEGAHGRQFDTGNPITAKYHETPFKGWTYDGDARNMSPAELKRYLKAFDAGRKKRANG